MKKKVKELQAGDVINPPSHERSWLWRDGKKRMLTIVGIEEGKVDKGGLWLEVKGTIESPYANALFVMSCSMRPETVVDVASSGIAGDQGIKAEGVRS